MVRLLTIAIHSAFTIEVEMHEDGMGQWIKGQVSWVRLYQLDSWFLRSLTTRASCFPCFVVSLQNEDDNNSGHVILLFKGFNKRAL